MEIIKNTEATQAQKDTAHRELRHMYGIATEISVNEYQHNRVSFTLTATDGREHLLVVGTRGSIHFNGWK